MPALRRSPRRTTGSPGSKPRSKATSTTSATDPRLQGPAYVFVGGKGGVGKTTCAAALSVSAAASGRRVLVVSTDPAPSLRAVFARPIGPRPQVIPTRRGSLHAAEIDAPAALRDWLQDRRAVMERIALRGTWLDQEDVSRLLHLALPGIDELAALLEVSRLSASGDYDEVIVDTAPTGHTLRMLDTPDTLRALAGVFDSMQAKHRVVVQALRGQWSPDAEDAFISELAGEAMRLAGLLRDTARVHFSWVTLPEMMAIEETADGVRELAARGLAVSRIIVNRLTTVPDRPCAWCDARRTAEGASIKTLRTRLGSIPLIAVDARDAEPVGIRALKSLGGEIRGARPLDGKRSDRPRATRVFRLNTPMQGAPPVLGTLQTRLLLFGGKGGVGKTTCAASAAIAIARQSPARHVLLLSTDPAHSLADALGTSVGASAGPLRGGPPNLSVREMDAAQAFGQARQRYAEAVDLWFDRLTRGSGEVGTDATYDRRVMHGLMDLAPPGIDELTAAIDVVDTMDRAGAPDLIVMDTAPSGHALRLLETPALVQDWARALMSILLKYQPVTGVGELGAVLLNISKGLGRLRALLTNPAETSFIAVTRAAAVPRGETQRLLTRLHAMNIDVPLVLVNAVGRGTCARCRRTAIAEAREIRRIARIGGPDGAHSPAIALAPAELPPPHGVPGLRRWHSSWRVYSPPDAILC